MKVLVLFSGGMDSTVLLTQVARHEGPENVLALSIYYGSLHNAREFEAAQQIVEFLGIQRRVISIPSEIFRGGSSALLGETTMPNEEYHDPLKETPSATIVPFRNGVLISVAVAVANANRYNKVTMAAHRNDAIGYAYPDCMPEFLGPMAVAIQAGTLGEVMFEAPFIWSTKADLVVIGADLRAPLNLSWSCYRGLEIHCGECPTCHERQKAFHEAGFRDPTRYATGSHETQDKTLRVFPYGEKNGNN